MRKTYTTTKTKEELIEKVEYLKANYKSLCTEEELFPIQFQGTNQIRVGRGRNQTFWKFDFERFGEITVKRCMTFNDWLLIVSLVVIDSIMAFLIFYGRFDAKGVAVMIGLITMEVLPLYYIYVVSPLKKIVCFMRKYLGIYDNGKAR